MLNYLTQTEVETIFVDGPQELAGKAFFARLHYVHRPEGRCWLAEPQDYIGWRAFPGNPPTFESVVIDPYHDEQGTLCCRILQQQGQWEPRPTLRAKLEWAAAGPTGKEKGKE